MEMVVAVGLFAIVSVLIAQLFAIFTTTQTRAATNQKVQSDARIMMSLISDRIRTGKIVLISANKVKVQGGVVQISTCTPYPPIGTSPLNGSPANAFTCASRINEATLLACCLASLLGDVPFKFTVTTVAKIPKIAMETSNSIKLNPNLFIIKVGQDTNLILVFPTTK